MKAMNKVTHMRGVATHPHDIKNEESKSLKKKKLRVFLRTVVLVCVLFMVIFSGVLLFISKVLITEVHISGDVRIPTKNIMDQIRIVFPIKYFDLSTKDIVSRLENYPLIYRAKVSKTFSGKLRIVLERASPLVGILAELEGKEVPSYFDKEGKCVQVGTGMGIVDVPIVSGIRLVNPSPGVFLPDWTREMFQNLSNIKQKNANLFRNISEIVILDKGQNYRILEISFVQNDASFIMEMTVNEEELVQVYNFANSISNSEELKDFDYFDVRQGVIIGKRRRNVDET